MRDLGQRYAQYFNKRYQRTGTLWEGRYRSCVVESARYVLACHRYIELNPVRAGMVAHPAEYRWSSYQGSVGMKQIAVLTPHPEITAIGSAAYGVLTLEGLEAQLLQDIRESTKGGYPLVSPALKGTLKLRTRRTLERGRPGPKPHREPASSEPDPELFGV